MLRVFNLLLSSFLIGASTALAAPTLTLKYFNARGAAEVTRVLLALGELEYVDHRYEIGPGFEAPEFKQDKESGALVANLNRAPLLLLPEGEIGQSKAMERFVAGKAGLMGSNSFEAAQVDMVAEHVRDIRDAQRTKGFSPMSQGKSDEEKAELRKAWFETDLPSWLSRLEACLVAAPARSDGHAVGDSLSYADVCIWALLREGSDLDVIAEAASHCTTLNCIADAVAAQPRLVEWIAKRPETRF